MVPSSSADQPSTNRVDTSSPEGEQQDVTVGGRKRMQEEAMIDVDAVTDEEVEEFCAILRRLRRPVKYFNGGRVVKRWRPSFVAEDFNGVDGGGEVVKVEKEKEKENENEKGYGDFGGGEKGLDLNVGP